VLLVSEDWLLARRAPSLHAVGMLEALRSTKTECAHFDREQLAKELDGYQGGRNVDAQAIKAWMKNRYHSLKRTNGTRSLVPGERKERQDFNSSQLKRLLEVSLLTLFPASAHAFFPSTHAMLSVCACVWGGGGEGGLGGVCA
jgi:hypothetical protein